MSLPIKIIIESVIQRANNEGVPIYILQSGDEHRGALYIKTKNKDATFSIHARAYNFNDDAYVWESTSLTDEKSADMAMKQYSDGDRDCWTIDIEQSHNPFKDIF